MFEIIMDVGSPTYASIPPEDAHHKILTNLLASWLIVTEGICTVIDTVARDLILLLDDVAR
jgi:hypothetical protein